MNTVKRYIIFFLIGGFGYGIIELLWRGRTHWTMLIAGGICFIGFSLVADKLKGKALILKAVICSLIITTVELAFGLVFNVWLCMKIWDYSEMPLNLLGQICPFYSFMWAGLSLILLPLAEKLNELLEKSHIHLHR